MPAQDLPLLPDSAVDALAKQPLQRTQQELRRLLGFLGEPLDMAVTYRALLDAGLISLSSLDSVRPGSGVPPSGIVAGSGSGTAGPPGPPGPPGDGAVTPDLTPPPDVLGLAAFAGISRVVVTWTVAGYTVGHGPGQVNLYVALRTPGDPQATFSDASLFYNATHPLTIATLSVEPNTRVHIWAKHQTVDGVESPSPAGGTNGVIVTTGQDVSHLLAVLTGAITASQLQAALSARIDLIDAGSGVAGSVNARILTETTARTSADDALTSSVTSLNATVASNTAAISAETTARANADTAATARIDTLRSAVNPGAISDDPELLGAGEFWTPGAATVVAGSQTGRNALRATATAIPTTRNSYAINAGKQYKVAGRFRSGGGASALRTAYLGVQLLDSAGVNIEGDGTFWFYPAPSGSAPTASFVEWSGTFGFGSAKPFPANARYMRPVAYLFYNSTGTAPSGGWHEAEYLRIEDAEAQRVDAAVQVEASTRASVDGHMSALYAVRVALTQGGRTVQGGFGIMGTSGGTAGPTIDFGVLANRFYVGAPVGTVGVGDVQPFVVQTVDETINGVVIPKGVYMDAAYIKNLTAMVARLGNAWIDDAKIGSVSAGKITAGSVAVGAYIQSTNYVANTSGWRIHGDGTLEMNSGTFRGSLAAATGTFSGALNAATGTFAGSLSADQVTTGALRGISVNAGTFATRGSYFTVAPALNATTVTLKDTTDFHSSGGTVYVVDTTNDENTFTYTGKTATTLTGCVGVLAHNNGAYAIPLINNGVGVRSIFIDAATNDIRVIDDIGGGTFGRTVLIGPASATYGANAVFGRTDTSTAPRIGITGYSYNNAGVRGHASGVTSAIGVFGSADNGYGVRGYSNSSYGVYGESTASFSGYFESNDTCGNIRLPPRSGRPTNRTAGSFAVIYTAGGTVDARTSTPYLMMADGTNWRLVENGTIWNG